MKLTHIFLLLLTYCIVLVGAFYLGFDEGSRASFEKIISRECWLNKTSRDIECITYIGE